MKVGTGKTHLYFNRLRISAKDFKSRLVWKLKAFQTKRDFRDTLLKDSLQRKKGKIRDPKFKCM